jgi:hypothetical protein
MISSKKKEGGEDKGVVHPAVDLAAGVGVYTAAYAKCYHPPTFQGTLEWYPTDWTGDPAEPGSSDRPSTVSLI